MNAIARLLLALFVSLDTRGGEMHTPTLRTRDAEIATLADRVVAIFRP